MNSDNEIKVITENGVSVSYGRVPDLWHLAMYLKKEGRNEAAEEVLHVWHMAIDLKNCIERQGQARLVSPRIEEAA